MSEEKVNVYVVKPDARQTIIINDWDYVRPYGYFLILGTLGGEIEISISPHAILVLLEYAVKYKFVKGAEQWLKQQEIT